jgi:Mg2+-importing ATPase
LGFGRNAGRPIFKSKPGKTLLIATLVVDALTLALPYTPIGDFLGFSPISPLFILLLEIILAVYMLTAEVTKHFSIGGCMPKHTR